MNTVKSNFSLNSFSDIEYRALNRLKNAKIDEDFQGEPPEYHLRKADVE